MFVKWVCTCCMNHFNYELCCFLISDSVDQKDPSSLTVSRYPILIGIPCGYLHYC